MSGPPPYSTPSTTNPDRRPLPDGYITRYDENYRAWYYVWTRSGPPRSSWTHPLDAQAPSSPPQANFAPPPNPPPDRTGFPGGGGRGRQFNPPQPASATYPGPQQYPPSFPGSGAGGYSEPRYAPTQGYPTQPNFGAPSPNYGNQWQQQTWQQPPAQPAYVPQTQQTTQQQGRSGQHHGVGVGGLLAGGAAGLIGGALLTEAFEHHEDEVREESYDQGFDNGFDDGTFDEGF
ncbi:hypothetical protein BC827DRAFT_1270706 [Russula dissimulans]|nr:hypothetical protein BC827DRAFT_1270706 [Russula dissimulans]